MTYHHIVASKKGADGCFNIELVAMSSPYNGAVLDENTGWQHCRQQHLLTNYEPLVKGQPPNLLSTARPRSFSFWSNQQGVTQPSGSYREGFELELYLDLPSPRGEAPLAERQSGKELRT